MGEIAGGTLDSKGDVGVTTYAQVWGKKTETSYDKTRLEEALGFLDSEKKSYGREAGGGRTEGGTQYGTPVSLPGTGEAREFGNTGLKN